MKRILLGALIVGVGLFALVYVVGLLLPTEHVASVRATFGASPEDVFARISDYERYPDWRSTVDRIERLEPRDGLPAWREIGGPGPIPMALTESDPPSRMVTTILDEGLPFGGRWIFEVAPGDDGATLTITEEGEVYSPIFRFVSRFVMGYHGTASTYLVDLGRALGDDELEVEVVR